MNTLKFLWLVLATTLLTVVYIETENMIGWKVTVPTPRLMEDPCGLLNTHSTQTITYEREIDSKDLRIEYNCNNTSQVIEVIKNYYGEKR